MTLWAVWRTRKSRALIFKRVHCFSRCLGRVPRVRVLLDWSPKRRYQSKNTRCLLDALSSTSCH
jgi:hypothetical protein